jgi:peptidoglycan/LPS O-acetylase OafA/YrhL
VVLPALLLTAVIGWIVRNFDPALSDLYSRGAALPRYVLSGLFLNEIWFFSAAPPINRPLWSLSFEFWYYAIFGLWWFRGKGWKSFFLPLIACVMAGPKILLMMPIWLMGGAAFYGRSPACSPVMARTLIAGGLLLIGAAVRWLPQMPAPLGLAPFFFANQFVTDWIIGVLVAGCLWPLPAATSAGGGEVWGMKTIRNVADLTFAIYVLHHPLLVLFRALVPFEPNDGWQALQAGLAVIAVASLLGVFLEWQRPIWVKLFKRVL